MIKYRPSDNLLDEMRKQGHHRDSLEKLVGISAGSFTRAFQGKRTVSEPIAKRIANALAVEVDAIFVLTPESAAILDGFNKGERVGIDRFWSKVGKSDGCWEWLGSKDELGRGRFGVKGKPVFASRYAYAATYGPIPPGKEVCHRCDNAKCVRPDHLFLGTHKENMEDMSKKGRGNGGRQFKITADDVKFIRDFYAVEPTTCAAIASMFGICQQYVGDIVARRVWTNI